MKLDVVVSPVPILVGDFQRLEWPFDTKSLVIIPKPTLVCRPVRGAHEIKSFGIVRG